jgi:hypothetical protein
MSEKGFRVYKNASVKLPAAVGKYSRGFGHSNQGLQRKKYVRVEDQRPMRAYMVILFWYFVDTQFHHTNNSTNYGAHLKIRKLET